MQAQRRILRVVTVQVISGAVTAIFSEGFTVADFMPVASNAPVLGSYSITAPSGKVTCMASADADGAGNSSETMQGITKAVSSSPPRLNSKTCSSAAGAHHERERPARDVSLCSQSVKLPPVLTRHVPATKSTSATVPMRIRLRSRRGMSFLGMDIFMDKRMPPSQAAYNLRRVGVRWHNIDGHPFIDSEHDINLIDFY